MCVRKRKLLFHEILYSEYIFKQEQFFQQKTISASEILPTNLRLAYEVLSVSPNMPKHVWVKVSHDLVA